MGSGITIVPVPYRVLILSVISLTFGNTLESASFCPQVIFMLNVIRFDFK